MSELGSSGHLRDGLWIKPVPSLYTASQLSEWLDIVKYKETIRSEYHEQEPSMLDKLTLLTRLQLTNFPYENTAMHYTSDHIMDISPQALFDRLVKQRKGSYCFGLNGFFIQILRALGYRAYSGAARINIAEAGQHPNFLPFVHMIIFVQPFENSNVTYLVDAGCGSAGPSRPMLLTENRIFPGSTLSERHRLIRASRSDSSLETSPGSDNPGTFEWRVEVFQDKTPPESGTWRAVYSFIEDEFFTADYTRANFGVYMSKEDFFWEKVVCSQYFFLDDDEMREVDPDGWEENGRTRATRHMGRLSLDGNQVKRHVGTGTEMMRTVKTEEERRIALKEFFEVDISPEDLVFIKGRQAALE